MTSVAWQIKVCVSYKRVSGKRVSGKSAQKGTKRLKPGISGCECGK